MVIAKVRSGYVPVEILGFDIKRKSVHKQEIQRRRNVARSNRVRSRGKLAKYEVAYRKRGVDLNDQFRRTLGGSGNGC